jgi:hypothetical protein
MRRRNLFALFALTVPGVTLSAMAEDWTPLFDFARPADARGWYAVNDGVMGGVSEGEVAAGAGALRFAGRLSLAYGGGFASCRGPLPRALPEGARLRIEVEGDGRRWQFRLKPGRGLDGIAWRAEFDTRAGATTVHEFAAADFVPVFRGRILRGVPPLALPEIGELGFLLADGRAGSYVLAVRRIAFAPP